MIIGFVFWSVIAALLAGIGVWALKAKHAVAYTLVLAKHEKK